MGLGLRSPHGGSCPLLHPSACPYSPCQPPGSFEAMSSCSWGYPGGFTLPGRVLLLTQSLSISQAVDAAKKGRRFYTGSVQPDTFPLAGAGGYFPLLFPIYLEQKPSMPFFPAAAARAEPWEPARLGVSLGGTHTPCLHQGENLRGTWRTKPASQSLAWCL